MSFRFPRTAGLALILGLLGCVGCGGGVNVGDGTIPPGDLPDTEGTFDLGATPEASSDDTTPVITDTGATGDETSTPPDTAPPADTGAPGDETAVSDGGGTDESGTTDGAIDESGTDSGVSDTGGGADTGGGGGDGAVGDPCSGAGMCSVDSDGDGIPDSVEGRCVAGGAIDTDKDGIPDYLDDDSDDDGIPDSLEWAGGGCDPTATLNDIDGDGIPNFRDLDSDGNGLSDALERCPPAAALVKLGKPACAPGTVYDFDGDGIPDFLDIDNDHDSMSPALEVGLEDKYELSDNTGKYVGLVDTDGDGIPDVYDRDSDNDFILDLNDGLGDLDKDGKPNFRDTDSDGDGISDSCEARGKASPSVSDYLLPLVDTDGDGKSDFLDTDSDGDLLLDANEDKNGNCIVDATETSRTNKDTDGDGVDDLIETALIGVAGAKDPTATPAKAGKFYFIVPWSMDGSAKPTPASTLLALSTTLNKGDVAFVVDTTGSMGGTISGLRTSLSSTIIPALKTRIPDLGIGVAAHDDFPYSGFGGTGDRAFYISSPPSGYVTTSTATAQAAANALVTHNGADLPESNVPAMYKALTGAALTWPGGSIAADSPPAGTFGAMRFRSDALPILINLTDVPSHNGKSALDKNGVSYDGSFQYAYSFTTYNIDQLVAQFAALGAKFIGGAADGGSRSVGGTSYGFLSYLADKTGSVVPPSAFGAGSTQCRTGVSGALVAPDGPTIGGVKQCRLVFSFNSSGSGLSTSVVDGVVALLNTIKFDVYVEAYNDAAEVSDVVTNFMEKVEPQPGGGTDPVTGTACVTFPASQLADVRRTPKALAGAGDIQETIRQVNPGAFYCFSVVPKPNTVVTPSTVPQTFKAWLRVHAVKPTGGTFVLGTDREVLFLVPPIVN